MPFRTSSPDAPPLSSAWTLELSYEGSAQTYAGSMQAKALAAFDWLVPLKEKIIPVGPACESHRSRIRFVRRNHLARKVEKR